MWKESKTGLKVCGRCLSDPELKYEMRMLYAAAEPLVDMQFDSIDVRCDPVPSAQWQAAWAHNGWCHQLAAIANTTRDLTTLTWIHVLEGDLTNPAIADEHVSVLEHWQEERAQKYMRLVGFHLSVTGWSSMIHSATCPDMFAGLLIEDAAKAQGLMWNRIRVLWLALRTAVKITQQPTHPMYKFMVQLLDDLAYHRFQINLEIFILSLRCEWVASSPSVQQAVRETYTMPANTKDFLEDIFNELKAEVQRIKSKRKFMARWRRQWLQFRATRVLKHKAVKPIALAPADWAPSTRDVAEALSLIAPGTELENDDAVAMEGLDTQASSVGACDTHSSRPGAWDTQASGEGARDTQASSSGARDTQASGTIDPKRCTREQLDNLSKASATNKYIK